MHRLAAALALLLISGCAGAAEAPAESPTWRAFRELAAAERGAGLPDYAIAGYARGERTPQAQGRRFDVTTFGARPDDLEDDRAGITAAIAAAEQAGGGVVFLPRGRYLVNTTFANRGVIPVGAGKVVIKGEGCGAGGTIIHCIQPFDRGDDPQDPKRLHLGDTVFSVCAPAARAGIDGFEQLARVSGDAQRGGRDLAVDDAARIAPGDWVVLWVRNHEVARAMIAPFAVEPEWTSITEDKARIAEIHQVAAVRGSTLVFAEPVRHPVQARHGWVVRRFQPIAEVGFEDICFLGNAHQRYVHHRSDLDDSGWSFIKMLGVVNGWVQRCIFVDSSQAVTISLSAFVSLLNLRIDGNQGHHGLRSLWFNYGVLGGLCVDRAACTHGPSVSQGAVGTVWWRCEQAPEQPIDFHAGRPLCTLVDACRGGVLYGSTGGLRDFPQHLRDLTFWNLEHRAGLAAATTPHYDFWRPGKPDRLVLPSVVGLHGAPATFAGEHLALLESNGAAVAPASLFEAQLALRLGAEPAWIARARQDHAALLATPLPEHFSLNEPGRGLRLVQTVVAADLLRFLATRSLEINHSRSFAWTVADPTLSLRCDRGMLHDGLYALMYALYRRNREDCRIAAEAVAGGVVFRLRSGPVAAKAPLADEVAVADARIFAAAIGGTVAVAHDGGCWTATLTVPTAP
jgi:hypothetical protein